MADDEAAPESARAQEPDEGDAADDLRTPPEARLSATEQRRFAEQLRELRTDFIAEASSRNAAYGPGDAFTGDKVGGDKHVYITGDKRDGWIVSPVAAERRRDISVRFAGTPAKESLITLLDQNVVAVLKGPPGTGRRTTALAALAHRQDELRSLRAHESPALLEKSKLQPGHGYLYDATGATWTKRLTEADILGCSEILTAVGARLVILVGLDSDTRALPGLVAEHVQPDPWDVLRCQLLDRLPAGQDVQAVIDQVTMQLSSPADARELAHAIVNGLPRGRTVEEVCAEMLGPLRLKAREVLRQEEDEKDLGRRAFVIAGAVLDGSPTVQVCRAAYDLAKLLFKVEKQGKRARLGLLPFADMLDDWLGHAGEQPSYVVQEVDRTLSFRAGFAPAVLDAVWLDYVVAHKALLEWLTGLAEDEAGDPVTRLRVAQAIAWFARYDFEFVYKECISKWSGSGSEALHMAAAWALEAIAAAYPSRHPRVAKLAWEWAKEPNFRLRSTAVRLFGTLLGAEAADEALRALYALAWRDPLFLSNAVRDSVVELFRDAPGTVLRELLGWSSSPKPLLCQLVAATLARIALLPFTERPTLLVQYAQDPSTVGELWLRVLTSRSCGHEPWNALREWAKAGVDFADLRTHLYAEPALRPRLRFYGLAPATSSKESSA
ncbi:hypothetical protein SMC26_24465 [Actinomadura fulvescens]|uniref:HEAT repeat domain-containing protein n=1 Tax=Actinomadura fulvescens TaxID=46160 RepID=A0ABN3Q038_9ACTN